MTCASLTSWALSDRGTLYERRGYPVLGITATRRLEVGKHGRHPDNTGQNASIVDTLSALVVVQIFKKKFDNLLSLEWSPIIC